MLSGVMAGRRGVLARETCDPAQLTSQLRSSVRYFLRKSGLPELAPLKKNGSEQRSGTSLNHRCESRVGLALIYSEELT
jgi:hypothetical protein